MRISLRAVSRNTNTAPKRIQEEPRSVVETIFFADKKKEKLKYDSRVFGIVAVNARCIKGCLCSLVAIVLYISEAAANLQINTK
jgi:hypothetical protein